jgi:hypothetical protein
MVILERVITLMHNRQPRRLHPSRFSLRINIRMNE